MTGAATVRNPWTGVDLGSYNEGEFQGGPRWCHKHGDDDNPWGDDYRPAKHKKHHKNYRNRFCYAI